MPLLEQRRLRIETESVKIAGGVGCGAAWFCLVLPCKYRCVNVGRRHWGSSRGADLQRKNGVAAATERRGLVETATLDADRLVCESAF